MSIPLVHEGAAREYAARLFGGPITENETNPTCLTTATVLIDGNGDRVALVMVNQGANPVYVATASNVGSTNGILLAASGGSVTMDVTRDFTLPSRRWYGLATGGTSAVYVLEVIRVSLGSGKM